MLLKDKNQLKNRENATETEYHPNTARTHRVYTWKHRESEKFKCDKQQETPIKQNYPQRRQHTQQIT